MRYKDVNDLRHFTTCLSELFHIKVYPECTSFLGFTIDYNRTARKLSLSYPSYIPDLLARLQITNLKTRKSPCIYAPPVFGSSQPQANVKDDSPPATAADLAQLQIIVGSLLYYARVLLTLLCLLLSAFFCLPNNLSLLSLLWMLLIDY